MFGAIAWLLYMALEPYARRVAPRWVVSWTRLLEGRFKDPMVGRDLLTGLAAAAGVNGLFALVTRLQLTIAEGTIDWSYPHGFAPLRGVLRDVGQPASPRHAAGAVRHHVGAHPEPRVDQAAVARDRGCRDRGRRLRHRRQRVQPGRPGARPARGRRGRALRPARVGGGRGLHRQLRPGPDQRRPRGVVDVGVVGGMGRVDGARALRLSDRDRARRTRHSTARSRSLSRRRAWSARRACAP